MMQSCLGNDDAVLPATLLDFINATVPSHLVPHRPYVQVNYCSYVFKEILKLQKLIFSILDKLNIYKEYSGVELLTL